MRHRSDCMLMCAELASLSRETPRRSADSQHESTRAWPMEYPFHDHTIAGLIGELDPVAGAVRHASVRYTRAASIATSCMTAKFFVYSNIALYRIGKDVRKAEIAGKLS
jgi:hypothetical protein